ncbi:Cytochrome P450 72A15 [Ananas comosus]|uniref:Cytochrome P450 72A15 n=1 Tax=Ananas comosus TaxID=4615 RepID=A0A199W8A9_ANACO|nr:Cytochrome P450 72A15 [Ananas comosus]
MMMTMRSESIVSLVYVAEVVMVVVVVVIWAIRALNWALWRPKRIERTLRAQGLKGSPYRPISGDVNDNDRLNRAARSKPAPLHHRIVPRVTPFVDRAMARYGKTSFTWFGPHPRVTLMDPELVREVLSDKSGCLQKPRNPLARLLASGLAAYEGQKWDGLIGGRGSGEVDVWPELQSFTGDVISRAAFGSSYREGRRIFELQEEQAPLVMEVLQSLYIPGYSKEVGDILRSMIEQRVQATRKGEAKNNDLLGLLLESNMTDYPDTRGYRNNMTIEEVIEECKLFYFAGQETTSVLLTWTIIALSMHPDWQARARDEVSQVFGKNKPDYEGLNRLKDVTMVLHEVLRLYPPASMLIRETTKEMQVGNITFPAGVHLVLPILSMHHDAEFWGPDSTEFRPDRFGEGISKASKVQGVFFPFGRGPRICIGQGFALLEAKMALSRILQQFSFELSPSYAHAPYTAITLHPQHGAQIIFHRI